MTDTTKVICESCKTSPYPRGWIENLRLCWTCAFPRPGRAVT